VNSGAKSPALKNEYQQPNMAVKKNLH